MPDHPEIDVCFDAITLRLSVRDADAYRTCWSVLLRVKHPTGSMSFEADDIWIDNADFDGFVRQLDELHSGSGQRADLRDVSGRLFEQDPGAYFVLRFELAKGSVFEPTQDVVACMLMVREPYTGGGDADLRLRTLFAKDRISLIARAFESFPKWW